MKELPIIFCSESVRAILEGRKTQTRRLNGLSEINKRPNAFIYSGENSFKGTERYGHIFVDVDGVQTGNDVQQMTVLIKPKYQVGDILWVKETYRNDTQSKFKNITSEIVYKADMQPFAFCLFKWKSPLFMPKIVARIWLEVTGIRVERLQDISSGDAAKEGIELWGTDAQMKGKYWRFWDSLNAKRGYSVDLNPWVWVIEFKRINH